MSLSDKLIGMHEKLSKVVVTNLIKFLNDNLTFKVDDLVAPEHSKRNYINLSGITSRGASTDPRESELRSLANSYGGKLIAISSNGGLGVAVEVLDKEKFKKEISKDK